MAPGAARRFAIRLYPVVASMAAVYLLVIGYRGFQAVMNTKAYDLIIDWNAARALWNGLDPYSSEGMKFMGIDERLGTGHPPTTLLWLLPLADLWLTAAKLVWNELTLFCLMLHLTVVTLELELPSPLATIPLLFGAVLCTSWMRYHLDVGQLSELIALLYVLGWYHLRRGRDGLCGLFLGLAATIKFYPAVVVLMLLLCRRYRVALAAAAAWLAVALPITIRLGPSCWRRFVEQSGPYTVYWMTHVKNASLAGIIQQLHFPICQFTGVHRAPWKPGLLLASLLSLLLIALAVALGRRAISQGRVDVAFALFTALSMITNPYSWEHYDVTLILPFLVALSALVAAARSGLRPLGVAALAAALALDALVLGLDIHRKERLWKAWYSATPPSHLALHAWQVASWLPAPLLIVVLGTLARRPAPPLRAEQQIFMA